MSQRILSTLKGLNALLFLLIGVLSSHAQSLQLTAQPQWVNIGDLDVSGNQITVEALINWQNGPNVLSKHTGPPNVNYLLRPTTFEITTTNQFYLMSNPYTLQTNQWYHLAGVYNGSFIRYFVNGCLVIEQPATGNLITNDLAAAIGNQSNNTTEQFLGDIDELRIWNVARTQAQIAANMNDLPNPATQAGLLAYYKFTNNLINSQGNATFNGTGVGAISYGPEPPIIEQLSILSVVPLNVSCFGLNNGQVTINASGSGVEYSINGTNYFTSNAFSGLNPGNYTAYIRSAEGCILSQPFSITQPQQLQSSLNQTICSGETFSFNGQSISAAGNYSAVFTGSGGCDSTVTLNLTVIPSTGSAPAGSEFNTGNNGSGGTLLGGIQDLNWTVSPNNINGPYSPAVVMTSIPASYYSSPWPDCAWIAHNATGSHTGNVDYYYQTQFDLPCFNSCGQSYSDAGVFCLNLDFFADNAVLEIYVNGVPQSAGIPAIPPANPYGYVGYSQANMVSVSLCNNWQPGTNTLIVQMVSGAPFAGFLAQTSVNPPPVVTDTLAMTICNGQSISFGGQNYNDAGLYTATFTGANGCDSLVTLNLSVTPTPSAPSLQSNSPVCLGDTLIITTPVVTGGSYTWTGPANFSSSLQNVIIVNPGVNQSGTYSLSVAANGCTSEPGTISVNVNPIPPAPSVTGPSLICSGQNVLLEASGPFGADYIWSGPQNFAAFTDDVNLNNITVEQEGTYSLFLVESGCTSAVSQITVNVLPEPLINLSALPGCGQEVTFSVQFDSLFFTPVTFIWDLGDGNSVADSTFTYTYQQPGTYPVVFNIDGGPDICVFFAQQDVVVQPSPSILTISLPNVITPNGDGINDILYIDNLLDDCVEYELQIFNRWGNLLYTQRKGSAPFAGKGMFGNIPAGVYFFVIRSGNEVKNGVLTIFF